MKAIAIHYGHNCTVGYSENGQIISLISEERFCRVKNATGFPFNALDYIVNKHLDGVLQSADQIVFIDETGLGASYILKNGLQPKRYLDYYSNNKKNLLLRAKYPKAFGLTSNFKKNIKRYFVIGNANLHHRKLLNELSMSSDKVTFYNHHQCHAATAAYFKPFIDGGRWIVFTLDGEGDGLSSTVSVYDNKKFTQVSANSSSVSLGYLYAITTGYLGMKPNEHEFKLMGMAPYADVSHVDSRVEVLKSLIWITDEGNFETAVPSHEFLPKLFNIYAFERFDVICGAIQKLTEELVCSWIKYWLNKCGCRNVALSGGVFMNVKAVKRVAEMDSVDEIFTVPSASDESLPIGALWKISKQVESKIEPISHLYLGREFSEDYINAMIHREKLFDSFDIEFFEDGELLAKRVAGLLADNEIVARCVGREEWGARALGNRSILCNPASFQNIERLNSKIKCRDFWMPFTPSILQEDLHKYIVNPKNIIAPYMAITFETTQLAKEHFPAAIHPRDFTMRPQSVSADWNAAYYNLINEFRNLTGISGVLNTSFNLHGEPNVSTPEDAIRTVMNSGIDYVLIGQSLFKKKLVGN